MADKGSDTKVYAQIFLPFLEDKILSEKGCHKSAQASLGL